jgi:CheY-like chemotaxis protein
MKARILIVDDERNLRVTLTEILASYGYEILEAENSVDALAQLRVQEPDLVFCDWKMPEGGGEELLQALQQQEEIRKPPVIIMTMAPVETLSRPFNSALTISFPSPSILMKSARLRSAPYSMWGYKKKSTICARSS